MTGVGLQIDTGVNLPHRLHQWPHNLVAALPAGADLKRALVAAMLEYIDAGWRLGEFSSRTGFFFCDKAGERRMVEISPSDPGPWRHV